MGVESFFLSNEAWAARKHDLLAGFLEYFRADHKGCDQFYCIDAFSSPASVNGIKHRTLDRTARASGAGPKGIGVKLIRVSTGRKAAAVSCSPSELPSARSEE